MSPNQLSQTDLLDVVLGAQPPPFALLYRPDAVGHRLEVLTGDVQRVERLADLQLPPPGPGGPRHELLALIPYRQVSERGFACHDDGSPLLILSVLDQASYELTGALPRLPRTQMVLRNGRFDIKDEAYVDIVRRVLADEIGRGTGANFVIKRSFLAEVPNFTPAAAVSLFHRLVVAERGAYWTFVVHTGDRTFVGATPERHVSLFDGTVVMNPISGTLRYPPNGPRLPEVLRFLTDAKETGELLMVVDEELKMMARITHSGGRVTGPYLKEMATLAHTEYLISGKCAVGVRDILRETMFAPTVVGSPLESACRVVQRYEPTGRGYYSGVAALISRDSNGTHSLDSAILLRTAEITRDRLTLAVGATLVRDSDPRSEAAETRAKAEGLLRAAGARNALRTQPPASPDLSGHPQVRKILTERNTSLAEFWLHQHDKAIGTYLIPRLAGRRALIVDAEDMFTSMLAHQLRALGLVADVRRHTDARLDHPYDLVVLGPGPGDPRDVTDPRIARMGALASHLISSGNPLLAVCLSHQILGLRLGFSLVRRARPNQGAQKKIGHFGRRATVGFYNTYTLTSSVDEVHRPGIGRIRLSRDPATSEVHALAGPTFQSMQFHPESILSQDGLTVLREAVTALLSARTDDRLSTPTR